MLRNVLLLLTTLISTSLYSQQWHKSGIPHGRDVNSVQIFSRDTILAAGGWLLNDSVRSIFKTYNASLQWDVYVDNNAHWIKSVEFLDAENGIAVGAGGTIIRTQDGGFSWGPGNSPINRDFNEIFFIDSSNYIIVGGEPGDSTQPGMQTILKTTNGGQSWNVVFDQSGPWLKSVYFIDSQTGFAVGDKGAILKTINSGSSWAFVFTPLQRDFNSVCFSNDLKGFIVGGNFSNDSIQTILSTDNGGTTWNINRDMPGAWLTDVSFTSSDTGFVVGDNATVLKTIDAGANWTPQTVNGATGDEHFNTVEFYAPDYGVIGGTGGAFYVYTHASIPEVYATGADLVDSTSALISGVINTFGQPAMYSLIYTEDSSLVNNYETFAANVVSNGFSNIQKPISFLLPDTTYYYTLKAFSLAGTTFSDTISFFTGNSTYEIKTSPSPAVSSTSATLSGSVRGFADSVSLFFQYGETPAFGNEVMATPATVNDTSFQTVTATLNNLQPNTLYYFRLKGMSNSGNYFGDIYPFFTGQVYNTLQVKPATNVTDSTAILNAFVSGFKVPVKITFEKSNNDSLFHAIPKGRELTINDSLTHMVSIVDSFISTGINYFRVKASTILGVFYSNSTFFISGQADYRMLTLNASAITDSSAKLNGRVEQLPQPVNVSFQYGATPALGNEIAAFPGFISANTSHNVAVNITGLQNNTVYYYRIKGESNDGNTYYGVVRQVFIGSPYIPNWDFQIWDDDTTDLPEDWFVLSQQFERVPGHSGNYSLKVFDQNIVVLGRIKIDDDEFSFRGVPFNSRPDSIIFWCDYNAPPADSMGMIVTVGSQGNIVGQKLGLIKGNSGGNFERLAFKIDYSSPLMPDSISIAVLLNNSNAWLTIDDISFSPAAPPLPNTDFENWFSYPNLSLRSWEYPRYLVADDIPQGTKAVTRTNFIDSADYAAEIHNLDIEDNGTYISGSISSSMGYVGSPSPSFPLYHQPVSLNGYFKYFPFSGDTMEIAIRMTENGDIVGKGSFLYADSAAQFQTFTVPIDYFDINVSPDSALISIASSKNDQANGPSRLIVDKLTFDGFYGSDPFPAIDTTVDTISIIPVHQQEYEWKIYPNPGKDAVTIYFPSEVPVSELIMYDLNGKVIYRKPISSDSVGRVEVSLTGFNSGFYIFGLQHQERLEFQKLIIAK